MISWLHSIQRIGIVAGVADPGLGVGGVPPPRAPTSESFSFSQAQVLFEKKNRERERFDPGEPRLQQGIDPRSPGSATPATTLPCGAEAPVGRGVLDEPRWPRLTIPGVSAPGYNDPRWCGSTGRASRPWRAALVALLFFGFFFGSVVSLPAQGDRGNIPEWKVDPAFKNDVFTFARVRYESRWGWRRSGGNWTTDTPDADLNLSFRLQQMTSLKVNPQPAVVDLTQKNLGDYPFIYIVEPGRLVFRDDEVVALRNYLEKGGFLMVDDFWGENEWANIESEIKRVFPNREIVDLPLEHPIFHCVFDLKEKPQVPGIAHAARLRGTGITWERDDAKEVHYRAIFDNKGRMMVIICQNTDNGDGWEEEGSAKWYFDEFSEKKAYPLTINIIFYAMTH